MGKSTHTREHILEMLNEYIKAERAVLTGKSYKIGTRELTRMSIDEIRKGRAYWESELQNFDSRGIRRGVPRNL